MGRKANKSARREAKNTPTYRFKVGTTVLCRGENGWEAGSIIKLNYQNPGDPEIHPYQVALNCGRLIYCSWDEDTVIRSYHPAWWEAIMERDDLSDAQGVEMLRQASMNEDVNEKDHTGDAVLHVTLGYDWRAGVEAMLSLRADPNLGGKKHSRPLNLAISGGHSLEVIKQLLEARADPCLQDEDPEKDDDFKSISFEEQKWHRSGLHYAVLTSLAIAKLLIQERADINQRDAQCKSPLHLAIEEGMPGTVDLLLESKADVNTGNMTIGMTSAPLLDAAYRSDVKLLEALLTARSDVNRQGKQGMTALHMALRGKQAVNVRLLLDAQADVTIQAAGKTAAHLAAQNGMKEFSQMLDPECVESPTDKGPSIALDAELRRQLYLD